MPQGISHYEILETLLVVANKKIATILTLGCIPGQPQETLERWLSSRKRILSMMSEMSDPSLFDQPAFHQPSPEAGTDAEGES